MTYRATKFSTNDGTEILVEHESMTDFHLLTLSRDGMVMKVRLSELDLSTLRGVLK